MRYLTPVALFLLLCGAKTSVAGTKINSWKILVNENGYEFKYPDCWKILPDNPDELEQPVTKARDIIVEETPSCATPLLFPPGPKTGSGFPNNVGFSSGWVKTPSKEELRKKLTNLKRRSQLSLQRKDWLLFQQRRFGSAEAIIFVIPHKEVGYTWITWEMQLFCPENTVTVSGPGIKDPDVSYFEKFKVGDIGMPEPERTIFESVRCTESKK